MRTIYVNQSTNAVRYNDQNCAELWYNNVKVWPKTFPTVKLTIRGSLNPVEYDAICDGETHEYNDVYGIHCTVKISTDMKTVTMNTLWTRDSPYYPKKRWSYTCDGQSKTGISLSDEQTVTSTTAFTNIEIGATYDKDIKILLGDSATTTIEVGDTQKMDMMFTNNTAITDVNINLYDAGIVNIDADWNVTGLAEGSAYAKITGKDEDGITYTKTVSFEVIEFKNVCTNTGEIIKASSPVTLHWEEMNPRLETCDVTLKVKREGWRTILMIYPSISSFYSKIIVGVSINNGDFRSHYDLDYVYDNNEQTQGHREMEIGETDTVTIEPLYSNW